MRLIKKVTLLTSIITGLVVFTNPVMAAVPEKKQMVAISPFVQEVQKSMDKRKQSVLNPMLQENSIVEDTEDDTEESEKNNIYLTDYISLEGPSNASFKSFEYSSCITDVRSEQYHLLNEYASVDGNAMCVVDGRYCIAVGSYYASKIGTCIDVVLDTGVIIPCILGDTKSDYDTDEETHRQHPDGSAVEFIVDPSFRDINSSAYRKGNIEYVTVNDEFMFAGNIVEMRVAN